MTAPPSIIDRARKLRRLQMRAGTPGEALAAARALAKLIDKHRIDAAALCDEAEEEFVTDGESLFESKRPSAWREDLALAICRHYGVHLFRTWRGKRGTKRYRIHGTIEDVGCVQHMFAWLEADAVRLSRKAARGTGRRGAESWRLGFAHGISSQLSEARKEAARERADADGTAKAMIHLNGRSLRAERDFLDKHGPMPNRKPRPPRVEDLSYTRGWLQGAQHHLGKHLPPGEQHGS